MSTPAAPQRVDRISWLLIAAMLVPVAVAAVRVVTGLDGFHATSDNALNELIVRDIGKHPVLLGPFARNGWSHPGPLLYYLLWTPYRVFGSKSSAMLVGALMINGAAIATTIAIAKRWGGFVLAVPVALACGVLIVQLPNGFLEDPWNPFITVLPFGAFLMVAWAATCGDRWALPLAAFVGSFCAQTHVGYAALVATVLAWCVWRVVRGRKEPRIRGTEPRGVVALAWASIVFAIVWAPPVIEQLLHSPGNLRAIFRYFVSPPGPTHSLYDGYRVVAAQFTFHPDWILGLRGVNRLTGQVAAMFQHPTPLLIAPFALACVLAFRLPIPALRRLAPILLIPMFVGVISLAGTVGTMSEYRLRWVWVLAALCTAFAVSTFAEWLLHRTSPVVRIALTATGAAGLCLLTASGVANAVDAQPPSAAAATMLTRLTAQTARHLPKRPGVILIGASSWNTTTYLPGVTLSFERAGIRVKAPNNLTYRLSLGEHRLHKGERVRAWLALCEDAGIERVSMVPGARLLAYVGKVPRTVRAQVLRELARRRRTGTRGAMSSQTDSQLLAATHATAVFEIVPTKRAG